MPISEFRIVLICLFLSGKWGGDGNGFLLLTAPVGKCFFYRLCLVMHLSETIKREIGLWMLNSVIKVNPKI